MKTWDQTPAEELGALWALGLTLAVVLGVLLGMGLSSDPADAAGHLRYDNQGRLLVPIRAEDIRIKGGKHTQPIGKEHDTVWIAERSWY